MFLDTDSSLVEKVSNDNMKNLSMEEKKKLQMLAKRPMKQLKLELDGLMVSKSANSGSQLKLFGGDPSQVPLDQQSTLVRTQTEQKVSETVAKRIPSGNNLPPELTSALQAGLISPKELARMVAGEMISPPELMVSTTELVQHSARMVDSPTNQGSQTNSMAEVRKSQPLAVLGDDNQTRSSLRQIGEAVGDPDDELAIKDEELDETPTLTDEELATGWLDNDLLPSGWKLKIACDGKPSGEEVGFSYNFFFVGNF